MFFLVLNSLGVRNFSFRTEKQNDPNRCESDLGATALLHDTCLSSECRCTLRTVLLPYNTVVASRYGQL
jgi:hypothetical protein